MSLVYQPWWPLINIIIYIIIMIIWFTCGYQHFLSRNTNNNSNILIYSWGFGTDKDKPLATTAIQQINTNYHSEDDLWRFDLTWELCLPSGGHMVLNSLTVWPLVRYPAVQMLTLAEWPLFPLSWQCRPSGGSSTRPGTFARWGRGSRRSTSRRATWSSTPSSHP